MPVIGHKLGPGQVGPILAAAGIAPMAKGALLLEARLAGFHQLRRKGFRGRRQGLWVLSGSHTNGGH
jgi:hypothetical protein